MCLSFPPTFSWYFCRYADCFSDELAVTLARGDELVNLSPVGKSANISVVYKTVGLNLPTVVVITFNSVFFGIVAVHGPKFYTSLATPIYSVFE